MCSIMGMFGEVISMKEFRDGFNNTVSRGPDDSKIVEVEKGVLGFHRLAIMGLNPNGMQPFEKDGSYIVCNGEIYGIFSKEGKSESWRKIKKELEEGGESFHNVSSMQFGHKVTAFLRDDKRKRPTNPSVGRFLDELRQKTSRQLAPAMTQMPGWGTLPMSW